MSDGFDRANTYSSTHSRKLYTIIGIVPDHDDKVAEGALSTAYDETAAAWKVLCPFSLRSPR